MEGDSHLVKLVKSGKTLEVECQVSNDLLLVKRLLVWGTGRNEKDFLLNLAVQFGHLNMVSMLLGLGADPNCFWGSAPLYHAILSPDSKTALSMVRLLVENGAGLEEVCSCGNGVYLPLGHAVFERKFECVELLLELGADPDSSKAFTMGGDDSDFQITPLGMAVCGRSTAKRSSMVVALFRAGANPFARFRYGSRCDVTALEVCSHDAEAFVRLLELRDKSVRSARRSVLSLLPPRSRPCKDRLSFCLLFPRDVVLIVAKKVWVSRGDDRLWIRE